MAQNDIPDDLSDDQSVLLKQIPVDSTIGNIALIRNLLWDADKYWRVRNELLEKGLIARGRGRGGAVRRIEVAQPTTSSFLVAEVVEEAASVIREIDLYSPMKEVIAASWSKDHNIDPIAVEIIAGQGRRQTGGTWSRPDIVCVAVRTFTYLPGRHLDVVTFEIKPSDSWGLTAIYEAHSHYQSATHSYALLHVPNEAATKSDIFEDMCRVARTLGVGVIVAGEPNNWETWEEVVEPIRHEPDPEALDEFISIQLPAQAKEQLIRRLRN